MTKPNPDAASDPDAGLWIAARRAALLVAGEIARRAPPESLWHDVRRGIGIVVTAIETRYNLTRRTP